MQVELVSNVTIYKHRVKLYYLIYSDYYYENTLDNHCHDEFSFYSIIELQLPEAKNYATVIWGQLHTLFTKVSLGRMR